MILRSRAITLLLMGNLERAEADLEEAVNVLGPELYTYNWLFIVHARRKTSHNAMYYPSGATGSIADQQIADLFRGLKTLADVEAMRTAADSNSADNKRWPCYARFFIGQHRLAQGDVAGARADFASLDRATCEWPEADVAAAELKRLSAP